MRVKSGQSVIYSPCSDGGYGNAEKRPEHGSEPLEISFSNTGFFTYSHLDPSRKSVQLSANSANDELDIGIERTPSLPPSDPCSKALLS